MGEVKKIKKKARRRRKDGKMLTNKHISLETAQRAFSLNIKTVLPKKSLKTYKIFLFKNFEKHCEQLIGKYKA